MGNPPLWPTPKKRGDAYKQTTPLFCPPLRRSRMTALLLMAILIALGVGLFAAGTWYLRQLGRQLGMELDRRIEEHRRRRAP